MFAPDEHTCLHQYAWTRDKLVMITLADVASRVDIVTPGTWAREPVSGLGASTTVIVAADDTGDEIFLDSSGFLTPSTLLHGAVGGPLEAIKASPSFFDAAGMSVSQYFATSDDGTAVPYFVGAGGFIRSDLAGRLWRIRGCTDAWLRGSAGPAVVVPRRNLRAGQYPWWRRIRPDLAHASHARGRHKVAEDFAAVAGDLVDRGITTPAQLGAQGGSNGGLLMGIWLTKYPELFGGFGVPGTPAGHAAVPPAAGWSVLGGGVRRPGQPGRLGIHRRILRIRTSVPIGIIRRC